MGEYEECVKGVPKIFYISRLSLGDSPIAKVSIILLHLSITLLHLSIILLHLSIKKPTLSLV